MCRRTPATRANVRSFSLPHFTSNFLLLPLGPAGKGGNWGIQFSRPPSPTAVCKQLSPGWPLTSAEGPVLIKDNYIYSLAV